MEYINLGKTGLKVSRFSLGCMMFGSTQWRNWVLDEADARPVIKAALDAGINYFDTADQYSMGASEEVTGRALRDMARRDEVVISTKVYTKMGKAPTTGGLSRKHIMESIDASLQRLGMDYVDLFICHKWDYDTPIEETLDAMNDVVRAGKARYIGGSNYYAWQLAKALYLADQHGWTRLVTMQNIYNLLDREEEREMIPFCELEGVAFTPWSPLARGLLAGLHHPDYGRGSLRAEHDKKAGSMYGSETDAAIIERVIHLAKSRKLKPAQIALAWMMQKPNGIVPVVGSDSIEQLNELIAAKDIALSDDEVKTLEELYQPKTPFQESLKGLPQGITPYSAAST
ncbi:MAG: aldo/keto reductase [Rhodospirillaceae bacterium]|jgi:aryl-alcohol dehydrogenase-like predicted oxidoreductase